MKKYAILLSIFLFVETFAVKINDPNSTENILRKIISNKKNYVIKQWNYKNIYDLAKLIDETAKYYDKDRLKIIALIDHESGFNIYHKNYNHNKTIDYSLTQQNSAYLQERCIKLLSRYCGWSDIYNPITSFKLAQIKFKECAEFKGDSFFICYNNRDYAYQYTLTGQSKYWDKIQNKVIEIKELLRISQ